MGDVEVEGEHDAMGLIHLGAPAAVEQRARRAVLWPVAQHDVVPVAFEEGAVELTAAAGRDVDEDGAERPIHGWPPCPRVGLSIGPHPGPRTEAKVTA